MERQRLDQASLTIIEHLNHIENLIKPLAASPCRCGSNTTGTGQNEAHGYESLSFPRAGVQAERQSCQAQPAVSNSYSQCRQDLTDANLYGPEKRLLSQNRRDLAAGRRAIGFKAPNRTSEIDGPPGSVSLLRISADMGIESILQWPIFKERLAHLANNTLMEDLGQAPSTQEENNVWSADCTPSDDAVNLDHDTMDWIVGNFLVNNFPSNPILDPVSLRQDARQISKSGLRWDGRSCLVVSNSVYSMVEASSPRYIQLTGIAACPCYWQHLNVYCRSSFRSIYSSIARWLCIQGCRDLLPRISTPNWRSILREFPSLYTVCLLYSRIS